MTSRCFSMVAMFLGVGMLSFTEQGHAAPAASLSATDNSIVETPTPSYRMLLLARDPAIHGELRLSRKQIQQVDAAVAEVDHPFWVLRDVPVSQCREKLDTLTGQLRERLQEILTASQLERFDQVTLQARGFKALVSPEMAESLKLSDSQVAQLRQILTDGSAQPPSSDPKVKSVKALAPSKSSTSESQEILAVLSKGQSAKLAELAGKPFDLGRVRQIGCVAPEFRGVDTWVNSDPVDLQSLRGKVVAVHFWAFGCINCVHNLPHYQSWHEKFSKSQLTIVGIHTPETAPERSVDNLRQNIRERGIEYPVAVDAKAENWKAWGNHMWPSVYLIDKQGRVRYWWYGEMNWQGARGEEFMRKKIEELLAEK